MRPPGTPDKIAPGKNRLTAASQGWHWRIKSKKAGFSHPALFGVPVQGEKEGKAAAFFTAAAVSDMVYLFFKREEKEGQEVNTVRILNENTG